MLDQADALEENHSAQLNEDDSSMSLSMFDDRNCVFFASANAEDVGTILSTNAACTSTFGYAQSEFKGANVSTLMPEPFSSIHRTFLRKYTQNSTGVSPITRLLPGQQKSGYTFPLKLSLKEISGQEFGLTSGIVLVGIIRSIQHADEECFVVDGSNNLVTGWSSGCRNLFGAPLPRKQSTSEDAIYASDWLPEWDSLIKSAGGMERVTISLRQPIQLKNHGFSQGATPTLQSLDSKILTSIKLSKSVFPGGSAYLVFLSPQDNTEGRMAPVSPTSTSHDHDPGTELSLTNTAPNVSSSIVHGTEEKEEELNMENTSTRLQNQWNGFNSNFSPENISVDASNDSVNSMSNDTGIRPIRGDELFSSLAETQANDWDSSDAKQTERVQRSAILPTKSEDESKQMELAQNRNVRFSITGQNRANRNDQIALQRADYVSADESMFSSSHVDTTVSQFRETVERVRVSLALPTLYFFSSPNIFFLILNLETFLSFLEQE